jgi:diguanylate cyclase (GGDEF)-like protein
MAENNELDNALLDYLKPFHILPERIKLRLMRVFIVGLIGISYLLDALLLFLFTFTHTVQIHVPIIYALAGVGHFLIFSSLQLSGFTERFENPHMTLWQMAYAISSVMLGLLIAPEISVFFLSHLILIFTFGMLRARLSELFVAWILTASAIALISTYTQNTVLTLNYDDPVEYLLITVSFLLYLLRASVLGFYGHRLLMRMFNKRRMLELQSNHDALAGTYNRQNLDSILAEQINQYDRKAIPCSLARIDIDRLTSTGDIVGIEYSRKILDQFANFLQNEIQTSDILIHYGLDQFIIIMTATNLKQAEVNIQTLNKKIDQFRIDHHFTKEFPSISMGLTQLIDNDLPEDLINRADYALYSAKQKGMNQISIRANLPSTPS